jgi:hypothetical protein
MIAARPEKVERIRRDVELGELRVEREVSVARGEGIVCERTPVVVGWEGFHLELIRRMRT